MRWVAFCICLVLTASAFLALYAVTGPMLGPARHRRPSRIRSGTALCMCIFGLWEISIGAVIITSSGRTSWSSAIGPIGIGLGMIVAVPATRRLSGMLSPPTSRE
jgi:hypothetical protein